MIAAREVLDTWSRGVLGGDPTHAQTRSEMLGSGAVECGRTWRRGMCGWRGAPERELTRRARI